MRADNDPEFDPQRLRDRILKLESLLSKMLQEDVVLDNGRHLKIRSPNGHYWSVTVSNAGVVALVDMGTSL